ncbi:MAG: PIN domain-containing protein [Ferruginibacter sp.]
MSGHKVLFDTNAVGFYLDDEKFAKKYLKANTAISISIITQLEFLSNPELTAKNRFIFDEFVDYVEIYPVTRENKELVMQVVSIRKKYKLKLPDAIIAATAIINNATLFSADDVFSKIFNLKFEIIKYA